MYTITQTIITYIIRKSDLLNRMRTLSLTLVKTLVEIVGGKRIILILSNLFHLIIIAIL